MKGFADIDYLVVGHLTVDLLPPDENGEQKRILGGTAAYAALTAKAMGLNVGVVSGWGGEIGLDVLDGIELCLIKNEKSTTFENIYLPEGRKQIVHAVAKPILGKDIPEEWRDVSLVHFAPVVNEIDGSLLDVFYDAEFYLTPQGFLRQWNAEGVVRSQFWADETILTQMDGVVLSREDVNHDVLTVDEMVKKCPLVIVTHGKNGAVVYNNGKEMAFSTAPIEEIDPTGAGDIFAASLFCCFWEEKPLGTSMAIAQRIAGQSVKRIGMASILSETEVLDILDEVQHG